MKSIKILAAITVCLLLAAGSAYAQGVGASGEITGTVMDPSGAVVPNATVVATEAQKVSSALQLQTARENIALLDFHPRLMRSVPRLLVSGPPSRRWPSRWGNP